MSYTFHVPYPKIFPERSLRLSLESPTPMTTFRLHILQATLVSGSEVRSSGTPLCWFHIWFKPVPVVLDIALFHELWLWLLVRRQPPTAYPWAAHGLCLVSHHWPSLGYQPLWLLVSLGTVALFSTFAQLHYQGFLKQNCRTFSTFLLSCGCCENQEMFLGSHLKCPWTVSSNWDALRTSCVPPWGDRSAWRINVRDSVSISQKRRKCKVCVTSSPGQACGLTCGPRNPERSECLDFVQAGERMCLYIPGSRVLAALHPGRVWKQERTLRKGRHLSAAKWNPETRNSPRSVQESSQHPSKHWREPAVCSTNLE